jgi:SnoaL-like domain
VRISPDYLELQDLVNRYSYIIDNALWDRLGEIFVEDGRCDYTGITPDFPVLEGLPAIRGHFESMTHPVMHLALNMVVEPGDNADEYRLVCKQVAILRGGKQLLGEYHDRVVRTPEGFKFAERATFPPLAYQKANR